MQDSDPNLPGFYQKPSAPAKIPDDDSVLALSASDDEFLDEDDELGNGSASKSKLGSEIEGLMEDSDDEFLSDYDEFVDEDEDEIDGSKSKSELGSEFDGFSDWDEEFEDEG